MNWGGFSVLAGLVTLGIVTFPIGLPILAFLAWMFWRDWKKR